MLFYFSRFVENVEWVRELREITKRPLDCIVPNPIEMEMSQIHQSYIKRELESERERERVDRKRVDRANEG